MLEQVSEDGLRFLTLEEEVGQDLETISLTLGELVLDEAWNHASRVHLRKIPDLHASLTGLPAHLHDLGVRYDVLTDGTFLGCLNRLITLA